jgi:hypothetical protein
MLRVVASGVGAGWNVVRTDTNKVLATKPTEPQAQNEMRRLAVQMGLPKDDARGRRQEKRKSDPQVQAGKLAHEVAKSGMK